MQILRATARILLNETDAGSRGLVCLLSCVNRLVYDGEPLRYLPGVNMGRNLYTIPYPLIVAMNAVWWFREI